jgi:hypothetical protein
MADEKAAQAKTKSIKLDRSYMWKGKTYTPDASGKAEVPVELADRLEPTMKAAFEAAKEKEVARQARIAEMAGNLPKGSRSTSSRASKGAASESSDAGTSTAGGAANDADGASGAGSKSK